MRVGGGGRAPQWSRALSRSLRGRLGSPPTLCAHKALALCTVPPVIAAAQRNEAGVGGGSVSTTGARAEFSLGVLTGSPRGTPLASHRSVRRSASVCVCVCDSSEETSGSAALLLRNLQDCHGLGALGTAPSPHRGTPCAKVLHAEASSWGTLSDYRPRYQVEGSDCPADRAALVRQLAADRAEAPHLWPVS